MIKCMNSNETVFYFLMGKFFADRKIIKEMDCQIYSNDKMQWYIMFDKEGNVIGFLSLEKQKSGLYLDNFYIIPNERGKGLSKKLLNEALKNKEKITLISRNEIAIKLFQQYGFKITGNKGRYKRMER